MDKTVWFERSGLGERVVVRGERVVVRGGWMRAIMVMVWFYFYEFFLFQKCQKTKEHFNIAPNEGQRGIEIERETVCERIDPRHTGKWIMELLLGIFLLLQEMVDRVLQRKWEESESERERERERERARARERDREGVIERDGESGRESARERERQRFVSTSVRPGVNPFH